MVYLKHIENEKAESAIQENALSVEVRGGWHDPNAWHRSTPEPKLEQFRILLCTGGPAVRIMGELDEHAEPTDAWLECQDWGTPWTRWPNGPGDELLRYASQFYFGE